ncbi:MAG: hypothetical protein U1E60_32115 [Reyranellaceae bacterium]
MIGTAIAWLNIWWPLMALPGAFTMGCGAGWLMRREDMLQANATIARGIEAVRKAGNDVDALTRANAALSEAVGAYQRDWQALRAIVEQHTVQP